MSAANSNADPAAQELAERVIRWFGFDDRRRVIWGPDYNQSARGLYEHACRVAGRIPIPADQPKSK